MLDIELKRVYQTICSALEEMDIPYEKKEEDLTVKATFTTEEGSTTFAILIGTKWDYIEIVSFLPFTCDKSKFIDLSLAISATNSTLADGNFWLDITDGVSAFKLIAVCQDSLISTGLVKYMIEMTLYTVNEYGYKFYKLANDKMTLQEYMDFIENS